jgi:non-ribosomal peptide synthetase component E (peptide arylation enzyme)
VTALPRMTSEAAHVALADEYLGKKKSPFILAQISSPKAPARKK